MGICSLKPEAEFLSSNGISYSQGLVSSAARLLQQLLNPFFKRKEARCSITVFVVIKAPEKNNSNSVWRLLNMLHLVRYHSFFKFASCTVVSLDVVVEEVP